MRRIVVTALISFTIFSSFAISPSPKVFASNVDPVQESETAPAPDIRTHTVTKVTVSPGPASFIFNDTISGVWYIGTLYKISEQIDPDGPYYVTRYSGTVYKK